MPDAVDTTDAPDDAPETITVRPWPDPVIDTLGHDARSAYVEEFWLPTLGPTTLLLLRHLAGRFEHGDDEMELELPVVETSHALGVGPRGGRNAPLVRSLERLVQFDLAYAHDDGTVAVRRTVPPVSRRHLRRLPDRLREVHEEWQARSEGPRALAERRAQRIAYTLAELRTDVDVAERTLLGLGFPPLVARAAASWAHTAHAAAQREDAAVAAHPSSQPAHPSSQPAHPPSPPATPPVGTAAEPAADRGHDQPADAA